ncbi:metallophosphoesterase [Halorubrum californiense DSM 19288]|uniref:Metallophosphoesterase n=1 Tax=Halorubrum californiense DSM 19288 TaxID=1227465 RepID=M0EN71_9EURY|nr:MULTISPECIES: metallophosphoesterase [Halorubrum]ELZ48513.1 metallophosphoesterase [Halorubrum californiense DSM 19288]TKX68695.1 metallophosphoesterase [Halorubrum sp. GN11GM_10-3_MGM]
MTGPDAGGGAGDAFADVAYAERAVYLSDADALVVADLHVGRGEASAVSLPMGERADLADRLDTLLDRFDPATVVVAGDVVHTFDRITDRSRGTLNALRDACEARGAALEVVAGNHDTALADAWDGPVREEVVLDGEDRAAGAPRTVVCHGHDAPSTAADRYVIGHVHPTIEIEGDRRPCVLRAEGTYRGADLLVVPAFTRLAAGVAVNDMGTDAFDSPLVTDADRLAPVVVDSPAEGSDGGPDASGAREALRFPPLGEFRRLL